MKKWEYRTEYDGFDEVNLNEVGQEGWELVAVVYADDDNMFYFKRPLAT